MAEQPGYTQYYEHISDVWIQDPTKFDAEFTDEDYPNLDKVIRHVLDRVESVCNEKGGMLMGTLQFIQQDYGIAVVAVVGYSKWDK